MDNIKVVGEFDYRVSYYDPEKYVRCFIHWGAMLLYPREGMFEENILNMIMEEKLSVIDNLDVEYQYMLVRMPVSPFGAILMHPKDDKGTMMFGYSDDDTYNFKYDVLHNYSSDLKNVSKKFKDTHDVYLVLRLYPLTVISMNCI